ncbi:MAG: putative tail length tape measure protein [Prokaryotic dsDNA virus sp.]|nr:MAG: putative tail length tape measure protein [Prokaryotic dsDNA virus sp.]|tara:strand:- start:5161 stop:6969 length:1809 start_codon:yes stop_codon:yes gene_type:complete
MIVRELITRLGFDADNRSAERHEKALRSVRAAALAVVSAAGVAGAALGTMARQTADAGREIARASRLANASTKEFQRFAVGAQTVGIENEKLSDILKDMNDRVGDFLSTGGGEMAQFFENVAPKVGVTAEQFRNLSGPQALQLYVDTLEKANLTQAELTFYMESIADESTALLPLLRNNASGLNEIADAAERYGAILSDEAIKQGEEFHRNLKSLGLIAQGLRFQIGEQLLPRINATTDAFLDWYDANAEVIGQGVDTAIAEISGFLDRLFTAGGRVADVVMTLAGEFDTLESAAIPLAAAILSLWRYSRLARIAMKGFVAFLVLDDLAAWVSGQESLIGRLFGPYDQFVEKVGAMQDAFENFLASIGVPENLISGISSLTTVLAGLVGYRLAVGAFATATAALGGGLTTLAGGLTALAASGAVKGLGVLRGAAAAAGSVPGLAAGLIVTPTATNQGEQETLSRIQALENKGINPYQGNWDALTNNGRMLGGNITGGMGYAINERGTEAIFPSRSAFVATNRALRSMLGMASQASSLMGGTLSASSGGGGVTNNLTANVTMQVPPGTPSDQVEILRTNAQQMFSDLLGNEIRKTMMNYPRAE